MRLFKYNILVLLPILLQYGVQGLSFDYAELDDFQHSILSGGGGAEKAPGENLTGENLTDENLTGENLTGEKGHGKNGPGQFITGADIIGENVTGEDLTGETGEESSTNTKPFTPSQDNADDPTGRCPFGLTFKKDCNTCWCDPKTGRTLCTVVGCRKCMYGLKWKIDCNTCICDEQTGITRCTRKECDEGTFSRCVKGKVYMKDCNYCTCSLETGLSACTKMNCPPGFKNKCPHGEYYSPDNGCNTCTCDLKTGQSLCTLVACFDVEDVQKLSKKQLAKNKDLKLKIKEAATGCTPPEVILIGNCRCDCRLPSVTVCNESCFLDPVGHN